MLEANLVSTQIEQYFQRDKISTSELTNVAYCEAVGCLMYLAVATRSDIAFAVMHRSVS